MVIAIDIQIYLWYGENLSEYEGVRIILHLFHFINSGNENDDSEEKNTKKVSK